MCSSRNYRASALRDIVSSANTDALRLFIQDNGQELICSYCGNRFHIRSCDDLASAMHVQRLLGAGLEGRGGPFCCPACDQAIVESRIKYCIQCGRHIVSGSYCSMECAIAFCED